MKSRPGTSRHFDWLPPAPSRLLPEGEHDDPAPPSDPAPKPAPGGFPANTAPKDMTAEEQAAYWQNQARVHERTAKQRADYDAVKAKADELDATREANATEHEKALKAAREEAATETAQKYRERIARQQFRVAAAGRVADAVLGDFLEDVNFAKFIKDDGEPDEDRISKAVARLAPEKPVREFPKGSRAGGTREPAPKSGVSAGRERYNQRRGRTAP